MTERLGDHGLPDTDGTVEDDRLAGVDEAQRGEIADHRDGDLRVEREVVVLDRGELLEAGGFDPSGQPDVVAARGLVLAEDLEKLDVAELTGGRLRETHADGVEHPEQLESGEDFFELMDAGHDVASTSKRRSGPCRSAGAEVAALDVAGPSPWPSVSVPGREDPFHRLVGRVADLEGPGARGIEALGVVFVGETDDALGLAEPIEGVDFHEPGDHLGDVRPEFIGSAATPGRGVHEERDLLRRVVVAIRRPASFDAGVGLDQLRVQEHFDSAGPGAGVDLDPDVFPRHRIQGFADLDVDVGADLPRRPVRQLEALAGQRPERRVFFGVEHDLRGDPVEGPALPLVRDLRGTSAPRRLASPRATRTLRRGRRRTSPGRKARDVRRWPCPGASSARAGSTRHP